MMLIRASAPVMTAVFLLAAALPARAQVTDRLAIRGKPQTLHLYGQRDGDPVIVSSGDGGWIHLGPQVAEMLAARGYFVVGFDTKDYLESFTSGATALKAGDVSGDYRELAAYATRATSTKPLLIGVSEGAALSALAATDPETKAALLGVVGLGLGDINELGWRWRDSVIYLTHGVPNEPTFSVAGIAGRIAPTPLAVINSTRDEFVPAGEVEKIMAAAETPKRLWMIAAVDHRFSDNQAELSRRLFEAVEWVRQNQVPSK